MKNANKRGKASKQIEAVEVAEAVEVEVTDEIVLDVQADITEVAEGNVVCNVCNVEKEQSEANFSPAKKGGFNATCKPCKSAATKEWNIKQAEYRKLYQRSVQLIAAGVAVIQPTAKTFVSGDVLMTYEYTDENGEVVPSREAEVVYAEMKAERKAQRDELKALREEKVEANKAVAKKIREDAKAAKDAGKAEEKRIADEAKAETKRIADEAKAEADRLAQEQAKAEAAQRAEETRQEVLKKAAEARTALQNKANERAEAIRKEKEELEQKLEPAEVEEVAEDATA